MNRTVIVLGKTWKYVQGRPQLSIEAKMTALAAGELYRAKLADKFIFSGGKTAGDDHISEAQAMAEYCSVHCGIPAECIALEEVSFDTIANARCLKGMLELNSVLCPILLTRDYHGKRARHLFASEGIRTELASVEEVMSGRSYWHCAFAKKYTRSAYYLMQRIKECLIMFQLLIDPEARMQRFITRRIRFVK